jgi:diguanylate cyclase (GGDEF)-like protein/PAS domain S-box-containing protein
MSRRASPWAAVIQVALVIFAAEFAIMVAIEWLLLPAFGAQLPSLFWQGLDPVLLTLVVAPVLYLAVLRPMQRHHAQLERQADELRIAGVAFEGQNSMLITDAAGVILRVNQAFTRLTGYSAAEAIGQKPAFLRSGRHDKAFYERLWQGLVARGSWQGEIWNRNRNGQVYAELLNITTVKDEGGRVRFYVGSFTDITEDKEAAAEIHRLAYYDALTRLPNRRLIHDRAEQAVQAAARSQRLGAICIVDLDNFKQLNDTRGHDVGDQLLVAVAGRFRALLREGETVGRQGGDEFVVLAEDLAADTAGAAHAARALGERLLRALEAPFDLGGWDYHCRLSIGVSVFGPGEALPAVLKHADVALYNAKAAGRNGLCLFDPELARSVNLRKATEAELGRAVDLGQLLLHYQPQVGANHRLLGAEALLRWDHPERGLLAPREFIRIAEESGLILPIGEWVLDAACRQIQAWQALPALRGLPVSVNVSARQLRSSDFVERVQRIVETRGIDPGRLKLELTETQLLDDLDGSIAKIRRLRAVGVTFSVDDFGTGYSSLSYLAQLPLDQLKIDGSFVQHLPARGNEAMVAKTIIRLGRELGLEVVAEGVECIAQRDFLADHGCEAFQGFLFSQPVTAAEFERLAEVGSPA